MEKDIQGIYSKIYIALFCFINRPILINCESQELLIIWTKKHDLKNKMRFKQAGTVCILLVAYHFTTSIERHTDRVLSFA